MKIKKDGFINVESYLNVSDEIHYKDILVLAEQIKNAMQYNFSNLEVK